MRRLLLRLIVLAAAIVAAGLWVTRPRVEPADALSGMTGDPVHGQAVFHAAGCASCHAPEDATGDDRLVLSGGMRFASPFGTFIAPNISPDPNHGIGRWSALDLVNALKHGTSPTGRHLYPVLPYTSYDKAETRDLVDLYAYLMTLPPSDVESQPHEVGFPFNIRAGLGLWKALFLSKDWVLQDDLDAQVMRGRYLVEALGHCGECHTPRNALGAMRHDAWLSGAPNPAGKGRFPNITPGGLDWSAADIAYYLETGFTPDFDVAGGHMAFVVSEIGKLATEDRVAVAAYLKAIPAVK